VSVRLERGARGARLIEKDCVLSEILSHPGPTNCLFDVLALCVATLAPGPRVLVLGFAGGGIVAPLRAAGWEEPLIGVDRELSGLRIFRELCGSWAGDVHVERADAADYLRGQSERSYDLIFEDLSVARGEEISKPALSLELLPRLIRSRLKPGGVALTNVLPVPGWRFSQLFTVLAQPYPRAVIVRFDEWENRLLMAGRRLASAAEISRRLKAGLRQLGSNQGARLRLRTFRG